MSNRAIRLTVTVKECWTSKFLLCLHLRFRTRSEQKEKNSRRRSYFEDLDHYTKNRFRYVMARLFLHRFFTHDFTAWRRKKNSVHTHRTRSWGKKQRLQEDRYFTSQPGYGWKQYFPLQRQQNTNSARHKKGVLALIEVKLNGDICYAE